MKQALLEFRVITWIIAILIIWAILNQAGITVNDLVSLIH